MKTYKDPEEQAFAELMQELARGEGRLLLEENERRLNDPDAAVPAELDPRKHGGQKHEN